MMVEHCRPTVSGSGRCVAPLSRPVVSAQSVLGDVVSERSPQALRWGSYIFIFVFGFHRSKPAVTRHDSIPKFVA